MSNNNKKHKEEVVVEITFMNNTTMRGTFFGLLDQRVIDIVNDTREFIPFKDSSNNIRIISKNNIRDVRPLESESDGGERTHITLYAGSAS